jgi:hypothetical protein
VAIKNSKPRRKSDNAGFRISNGPMIESADISDLADLPRAYGAPLLLAIARDPRTIFTYWSVDWSVLFAERVPVDRQVHLRVRTGDRAQETSRAVEPMAGNSYLTVLQQRGVYRVEIGYYQPEDVWNSVAISNEVTMPPDDIAQHADVDLVTIPFHLSFERLIDLFRASNRDALAEIISQFQRHALNEDKRDLLSVEEREILHAMDLSLIEIAAARRAFIDQAENETLRKRTDAILRSGSSSPAGGFGESSWSSASS